MRSVLIYDTQATPAQREALRAFVTSAAGKHLGVVVREEIGADHVRADALHERSGVEPSRRALRARSRRASRSRPATSCARDAQPAALRSVSAANPELFGSPLSRGVRNDVPGLVPQMIFNGPGLGSTWSIPDTRGGFVADFEIDAPAK